MAREFLRKLLSKSPTLDGLFRRVVWSRVHFPEPEIRLLHELPGRPFDLVVDVGAALGSYTWVLDRKARNVVAFEPGKKHFSHIKAARGLSRVDAVNAAVGASDGTAELMTPGDSNDGRHMATLSDKNPVTRASDLKSETVRVIALSSYLDQHFGADRKLDLLKIDVEGFENDVLEGAMDRITRDYPVVIAEVEARHNPDCDVFFNTLIANGYTCHGYKDGGYVPFTADDAKAQKAPDQFTNQDRDAHDQYVNNFVFQHEKTAVKILPL